VSPVSKGIGLIILVRVVEAPIMIGTPTRPAIPHAVRHENVIAGTAGILATVIVPVRLGIVLQKSTGTFQCVMQGRAARLWKSTQPIEEVDAMLVGKSLDCVVTAVPSGTSSADITGIQRAPSQAHV